MMKSALMLCTATAGLLLAGCYYQPRGVAVASAGPGYYGPAYYDGYYDDFYGPLDDGFWAPDGFFYYAGHDHNFHRGEGAHFRHDGAPGFHEFHMRRGPAGGGHVEHR